MMLSLTRLKSFQRKITLSPTTGCWLWKGTKFTHGYGSSYIYGKRQRAHRISWILHRGTIPQEMFVLHKCDTKLCVNPDHLYLGNHLDNARDAVNRKKMARGNSHGRHTKPEHTARGEKHGIAKLSNQHVLEIRQLYKKVSRHELAKKYNVHFQTITEVQRRRSWSHI